jgi:ABC-type branched-subunit amino acid transport system substrate-binding protein
MKKWYSITTMAAIAAMVLGLACVPQPTQAAEPIIIKIGVPQALSGPAAQWGQNAKAAYDVWVELFNKKGFKVGGKTYNFKLIHIDDKNSPEGGAAAAKQLIYGDGCKFIAGHWTWNFPAVAAVTNPAKVILMTRTGNEAVPGGAYDPKKMPYVVFANPSHEQFISDCLALAKAFPTYKKIGILDCTLGKGIGWDYVDRELDKAGIRFHHEWFPIGTQDFTPYITRYAQAGCDIVYVAGWIGEAMQFAKQRWEMGYKDMKVGHSGPFIHPLAYIGICGKEAAQGFIGQDWAPWDFRETKVKREYVKMCREVMKILSKKQGRPFVYTGWIGWLPSHLLILAQAMEKAGTVDDPDAIMAAIRGGTFSTTTGTWTMSGAKTYGSPVVFGCPSALSTIKGDKEVYLAEYPMKPLP